MKTRYLAFFGPLVTVLILVITNILFSGRMVGVGEKLQALEQHQQALRLENKDLNTSVAKLGSLHVAEEEAIAQGYARITTVAQLTATRPVALR